MNNEEIIKESLISSGFSIDKDKQNASAGWYNSGSNCINLRKLQMVIEFYNDKCIEEAERLAYKEENTSEKSSPTRWKI